MLSLVEQIALTLMVFVLMLGMGATLTWSNFSDAFRKPKGLIVGFCSHFVIMPIIAYGLAKGFNLSDPIALSLVMVGCTPPGTTSNLFTYYSKGVVALSISMTIVATFSAVLMMPLLLGIYGTEFTSAEIKIPYAYIVSTLLIVLVPVTIGVIIKKKRPIFAQKLEKMGSIIGIIIIIFLVSNYLYKYSDLLKATGIEIYTSAILLGLGGFFFGYLTSKLLRMTPRMSRTVAMETGIQNTPLTIAIIALTFPQEQHVTMLLLPSMYAFFIVISSSLVAFIFRWMSRGEIASAEEL